jgi:hypothetical protein
MTELVVQLPDELAQGAKDAGLMSDTAIARLLDEAVRREGGGKLLAAAERVHAAGIAPVDGGDHRRGQGGARRAPCRPAAMRQARLVRVVLDTNVVVYRVDAKEVKR